jgi:acyl carrier protein
MNDVVTTTPVYERVRDVVSEVLNVPVEKITPEADFRADLDAESLDLISLISELEEVFDEDITDDDAMSLKTVGDAVSFIQRSLDQKG